MYPLGAWPSPLPLGGGLVKQAESVIQVVTLNDLIAAGFQGIGVAVTAVVVIGYVRGRFDWDAVAEAESYLRDHLR